MKQRKLTNNLQVNEIGLGCMGLTAFYPPFLSEDAAITLIQNAVDQGINFFDTAEVYGSLNEEVVGKALKSIRNQVIIASKFGFKYDENNQPIGLDSSEDNIRRALTNSLKNLQTDYLDIFYQHRVDPNTPIEKVAQVMKSLIEEGKIRHWGLSEASAETIRRAHAICPVSVVQSEYSLFWREPEKEIFSTLEELGIGFVAYSPLGRGLLTNTVKTNQKLTDDDFRKQNPRFTDQALKNNQDLLNYLNEWAIKKKTTLPALAIAWILAQKEWIVPIFGTKKSERLVENLKATTIHFDQNELTEIKNYLDQFAIQGNRYDDDNEAKIDH